MHLKSVGLVLAVLCLHEVAAGGAPAGPAPSVLPPPKDGHPGWLFVMSHEGVHLVDSDGNGTETLWRWVDTTLDKTMWPDKCIPSGMAVDAEVKVTLWACNNPDDPMIRKVFRASYASKPVKLEEITFDDSSQPGLRGGVTVDPIYHHAYVAVHMGQGWRVQTFPLQGCESYVSQAKCDVHIVEGCEWLAGFCMRNGKGVEVLQQRTDYREGGGITYTEGNLILSTFVAPDDVKIAKKKEDGSGRLQNLEMVLEYWQDKELTSIDRYHVGHPVGSHDADPDHKVYLAAVGALDTRIYRCDPYDVIPPDLVLTLTDAPFRSPGTDGVTDPLNLDGAPMPAHATLWNQKDIVYSTGTEVKRVDWKTGDEKTILSGWAKMGKLGPLVWFPHEGSSEAPTVAPSTSPVVPPTAPPEQASAPTAPPQQQAASPPTDAPKGGGGNATPTGAPKATNTNNNDTGAPVTAAVVPSSPTKAPAPLTNAPTFGPVKEEPGSCDTICLVLIIAAVVLLCCLIAGFIAWYMKSKVPASLPPEEVEEQNKSAPLVEEPSAPIEQVTIEALPLGLGGDDMGDDLMDFKFNAKAYLKQLRNGEELHDPALDIEAARLAEIEAAKEAQEKEAKRQLVEDNMNRLLANLRGDEVDEALDQWKYTQQEPQEDQHTPTSDTGYGAATPRTERAPNSSVISGRSKRGPMTVMSAQQGRDFGRTRSTGLVGGSGTYSGISERSSPNNGAPSGRGAAQHGSIHSVQPHPFRPISESSTSKSVGHHTYRDHAHRDHAHPFRPITEAKTASSAERLGGGHMRAPRTRTSGHPRGSSKTVFSSQKGGGH
eukprot:Hpha_TRINITY_DN16271_c3_g2::TRINITY_DN16271_c3_g2_i1::g.13566::m.13566